MGWRASVQFPSGSDTRSKKIRTVKLGHLANRHPSDDGAGGEMRTLGLDIFGDEATTAEDAGELAVQEVLEHMSGPDTNADDIQLVKIVVADTYRDSGQLVLQQ
jgi:hypothetical protein